MDGKKIEKAVALVLDAIGENPKRAGLVETPKRVAGLFEELFAGIETVPEKLLEKTIESEHTEMVLLRNMQFYSVCEHHLLPFFGNVHLAYIPNGKKILGFGTIARFVELLAKRLQTQELFTKEIANLFMEKVEPLGIMVVVEARHLCMEMRGVKKSGSIVITSAVRGIFREDEKTRAEAEALMRK